jgi:hypothetical protein
MRALGIATMIGLVLAVTLADNIADSDCNIDTQSMAVVLQGIYMLLWSSVTSHPYIKQCNNH